MKTSPELNPVVFSTTKFTRVHLFGRHVFIDEYPPIFFGTKVYLHAFHQGGVTVHVCDRASYLGDHNPDALAKADLMHGMN